MKRNLNTEEISYNKKRKMSFDDILEKKQIYNIKYILIHTSLFIIIFVIYIYVCKWF